MPHVIARAGSISGGQIPLLLAAVHAVNDVMMAALGVLLPTIQQRFQASATTLAVLVAVLTIGASATQPVIGAVADRLGLRQVIAAGVALAAVSLSLVGTVDSLVCLGVLLFLGGLGSAALHPIATSIVGSSTARNPGFAVGLFTAGGMAGFAVGPSIILWFTRDYGLAPMAWLMLPGLLLAVALWRWLPDWEPHTRDRHLRDWTARNVARRLGWLVVTSVLVGVVFLIITSAVPLWLVAERGLASKAPLLGWVLGGFSFAAAAGAVIGGVVSGRLGYRRTTVWSLLGSMATLLTMVWLPVGPWTVAAATVGGALLYSSQPLLIVRAQEAIPEAPTAAAGIVIGLGGGIAGAVYVGVGVVQETVGHTAALIGGVALLLPAVAAAHLALRKPADTRA